MIDTKYEQRLDEIRFNTNRLEIALALDAIEHGQSAIHSVCDRMHAILNELESMASARRTEGA
jgi:hypothetical protein